MGIKVTGEALHMREMTHTTKKDNVNKCLYHVNCC